ncbi:MAG: ATP-binding protein, partial [Candidatus Binataceae bacterium]
LVRNGAVKLARPLASIQVPATVKGILAARIDRLGAVEKELLQTLAVLGKEFPLELVRRVTDRSNDELEPEIANLQVGEFIYEQPAFPESEYTFKHALTQEVAYDSLLIERRRQIHNRAAAAIEEMYSGKIDDHLSQLAQHYNRAGNADKAVGYLRLAAQQARDRSAYDDALGYVTDALKLLAAMPESRDRDRDELVIQSIRGPLLVSTRGFANAELEQCLNRGLDLCRRVGEGPEMFGVMFGLWSFNLSRNRLRDAMSLAEKILNLSQLMSSELVEAGAHSAFGSTCLWRGEFSVAREHLEQSIAIYDRDLPRYLPMLEASVVPSRCQSSWVLWMSGYPDQAHERAEEGLELATRLGRPFSMAFALMYSIALSNFRLDYRTIRPRAETLIELARENGFPFWSAVASMIIGRVLVGEGSFDVGIIRMREAMKSLIETGGELIYNYALSLLAEAYVLARRPNQGLTIIAEALRGIESSGQRMHEAEIWRLRGEIFMQLGEANAEAERSFRRALEVADGQHARSWELRSATSLARLLKRQERRDDAKSILAPVHASVTEGFACTDYKDASKLLGELD